MKKYHVLENIAEMSKVQKSNYPWKEDRALGTGGDCGLQDLFNVISECAKWATEEIERRERGWPHRCIVAVGQIMTHCERAKEILFPMVGGGRRQ